METHGFSIPLDDQHPFGLQILSEEWTTAQPKPLGVSDTSSTDSTTEYPTSRSQRFPRHHSSRRSYLP